MRRRLEVSNDAAAALSDTHGTVVAELERHSGCSLHLRGNLVTIDGDDAAVAHAATTVEELAALVDAGHEITSGTIDAVTDALDHDTSPAAVLEDVIWRHRGITVAPKSLGQKRYVDAIRRHTITFGVGPAGTGGCRHRPRRTLRTWNLHDQAQGEVAQLDTNRVDDCAGTRDLRQVR